MSLIIASFPETRSLAKKVAKSLRVPYADIKVDKFPDSEFHLVLKKNPNRKKVVIISSMAHDPSQKLLEVLLAGGIARDYGARQVILLATYFPYMRQDKHFIKYDSFSSKHVLRLFDEFNKIIAVDPHLHRVHNIGKLYSKAQKISTNKLIADYIKKRFKNNFTILGPDSESKQWASPIARVLKKEVVILDKTRFSGTRIKQQDIKQELAKNVIMIDDIISTGKTLAGALKIARHHGAKKLVCVGIHGILINNAPKLIRKYAELVTTNTIPGKYAKIDIAPLLVDTLRKYK